MENTNISIADVIESKLSAILGYNDVNIDIHLPIYIPTKHVKKILVLSGGGIMGIAFIGALCVLHEHGALKNLEIFAGTSVGSLILFLYIIGYTPSELFDFVIAFNLGKLKSFDITTLLDSYGLDSGDKLETFLTKFATSRNISATITFRELYEMTGKTFIVTVVNVNERKAEYLSHTTHPDVRVLHAIRMSVSIPFIFTPVSWNDKLYIDGSCIDHFSIKQFANRKDEVIGIYVTYPAEIKKNINSLDEYAMCVINSIIYGNVDDSVSGYNDCAFGIPMCKSAMDFDLSCDTKKDLYAVGRTAANKFIADHLI